MRLRIRWCPTFQLMPDFESHRLIVQTKFLNQEWFVAFGLN